MHRSVFRCEPRQEIAAFAGWERGSGFFYSAELDRGMFPLISIVASVGILIWSVGWLVTGRGHQGWWLLPDFLKYDECRMVIIDAPDVGFLINP